MRQEKKLHKKPSEQMRLSRRSLGSALLQGAIIGGAQGLALGIMLTVGASGFGVRAIPAGAVVGAATGAIALGIVTILIAAIQAIRTLLGGEIDSGESAGAYEIKVTPCS